MNNTNVSKLLPIGSVVLLKGGKKRAMITGFLAMPEDGSKRMFDYSGCLYPEGFISSNQVLLFNHVQIQQVYHVGLSDNEEKMFRQKLNSRINEILKESKAANTNNNNS